MGISYIEEIKNSFPEIQMPLSEEQVSRIEANCALKPQTIYIAKSDKVQELERELAEVNALYSKVAKAAACWVEEKRGKYNLDYKVPTFHGPNLPYTKYRTDGTYDAVQSKIEPVTGMAKSVANRIGTAVLNMQDMLDEFREKIQRDVEIEQKGLAGENEVEQYISRKMDCRVLSNVVLPEVRESADAPKTSETDLLVISDTGVYVCEIKNYGKAGQTLSVQPNGQIIKKDYYGRELENMGSPFYQNARHTKAVKSVLEAAGLGDMPVYSVVIIANTDVNVENNSTNIVTDMYGFCDVAAKGFYGATCTAEQQSAIFTAIQAKRMTERKFPFLSMTPVTEAVLCTCIEAENAVQGYEKWVEQTQEKINLWGEDVGPIWVGNNYRQLTYHNYHLFRDKVRRLSLCAFTIFSLGLFLTVIMGWINKYNVERTATLCGIFDVVTFYKAVWNEARIKIGADVPEITFGTAVFLPTCVMLLATIIPGVITLLVL